MPPTPDRNIKKILLIRLRSIGDIVLCGPAFEAIRSGYPSAEITCVVDDLFEDLVHGNPNIDRVLSFRKGLRGIRRVASNLQLFYRVFRTRFDLVVDFHGGPKGALLTGVSMAPYRVGQKHRTRNWVFNITEIPGEDPHSLDNGLKLTRALGLPDPPEIRFYLPHSKTAEADIERDLTGRGIGASEFTVMIHPGARVWFKRWPNENLYRVVDWLRKEYNATVVVAGNALDREELDGFREKFGGEVHLFPDLSLLHLIALIRKCRLFIGNDSGPMHLAAVLGIPTIALFGPSDPRIWGPRGDGPKKVFQAGGFECMPCDQKNCVRLGDHCMLHIHPEEVIRGIGEMISTASPKQ